MKRIVLHPTSTAQWQALINEAQGSVEINLPEELESYLVFLLMRFTNKPHIAQSVLGLEFLTTLNEIGKTRNTQFQDIGDKCLLFAGLFPERAEKKRVKLSYFVELGQTAYTQATSFNEDSLCENLSSSFPSLMDVLNATRLSEAHNGYHPLQAMELLEKCASKRARQSITQACNSDSPILISCPENKPKKH